jgi:hypothetical protein
MYILIKFTQDPIYFVVQVMCNSFTKFADSRLDAETLNLNLITFHHVFRETKGVDKAGVYTIHIFFIITSRLMTI